MLLVVVSPAVASYSGVCFVEKESGWEMAVTYVFRAGIETGFYVESVKGRMQGLSIPKQLPVEFGPFRIDRSPNSEFYLDQGESGREVFGWDGLSWDELPDRDYPISVLYVETNIKVEDGEDPEAAADEIFEELEAIMRLFRMGNVSIRRNFSLGRDFGTGKLTWFIFDRPIRSKPRPLYNRYQYLMDDTVLQNFREYFSRYWKTVHSKPKRIYNAIRRFSSSYEEREPADRLLELVIALESLFGGKGDSTTYKVALRASCFLYPSGRDRKETFKKISRAYDDRSRLIHGDRLHPEYTDEEIDIIEELLRKAINKFLEYDVNGKRISSEEDLNSILFFGNE